MNVNVLMIVASMFALFLLSGCNKGSGAVDSDVIDRSDAYCFKGYLFIYSYGYSNSVTQVFEEKGGVSVPMKCEVRNVSN